MSFTIKKRHLIDYLLNQENKSFAQITQILKWNKLQETYQANTINLSKHNFASNKYKEFLNTFIVILMLNKNFNDTKSNW
ncbi:MAG: hypothetical protein ACRC8P_01715 [Spiroplasma sp.]